MVNINDQFPSKYLKASDLNGQMVKVGISDVKSEEIGGSPKMVMYFAGKQKGMVLNKTNAQILAEQFGDETDNWAGATIEIFSMKVPYEGRMVDGLRVRIPPQPRQAAPAGNGSHQQGRVEFVANARDDARLRQGQTPQAAPPNPPHDDLNDEIPF